MTLELTRTGSPHRLVRQKWAAFRHRLFWRLPPTGYFSGVPDLEPHGVPRSVGPVKQECEFMLIRCQIDGYRLAVSCRDLLTDASGIRRLDLNGDAVVAAIG